MMLRSSLIFVLLFFLTLVTHAQREHYLLFQSGGGIAQVRDQVSSPLAYRGGTVPARLSYLRQTDTSQRRLGLQFDYGRLKPEINPELTDASLQQVRTQLTFASFSRFPTSIDDPWRFYLGGIWNNLLVYRIKDQRPYAFSEFASSVNFAVKTEYKLKLLDHDATLSYSLSFPFLSYVVRPGYANSPPKGFRGNDDGFVKSFFESGNIVYPLQWIRFNNRMSLDYYLENGNFLSLFYNFDYYTFEEPEKVEAAGHALMFGTAFHF